MAATAAVARISPKEGVRPRILTDIVIVALAFILWLLGPRALPLLPWLCLLSVIEISRHAFLDAKCPGFYTWFTVAYIGLFLVYPVVAPVLGLEIPTSDKVFSDYCFLAVAGIHLFSMGYDSGTRRSITRHWNVRYRVSSVRLFHALALLLVLNLFGVALVLLDAGSLSLLRSQSRVAFKFGAGLTTLAASYLFVIGSPLYPLLGVRLRRSKALIPLWLPFLVFMEVFLFLAYRVRTFPVAHLVGLGVGWFLIEPRMDMEVSRPPRSRRMRLNLMQKLRLLLLAALLVLGMFMLRVFRGVYEYTGSLVGADINVAESVRFAFEGGGELGYSTWVFRALELVPESHNYLHGQSYYRLLFVPVPRFLWPDKPLNTQRIVAQWIDPFAPSIKTTPIGIFGDLYINFGMWGVVGMLFFGFWFGLQDRGYKLRHALFLAVASTMVFHLVRGAFTNPILQMIVAVLSTAVLASYLARGKESANKYAVQGIETGKR